MGLQGLAKESWNEYITRTAEDHRLGDKECGRPWQCTCAACIQVREGMTKSEWLKARR